MKRLNPIYILALVVTFFIISVSLLNDKKEEFKNSNKQLTTTILNAQNYNDYKKTWFNKSRVTKQLDRIIKSSMFKKEKILKTEINKTIRLKIESNNERILDKFLNRVLNEKFIFNKIDIQKNSISFELGLN